MSAETLNNERLAEIIFFDTIIDITTGEHAGKVTAEDCLMAISGPTGESLATGLRFSQSSFPLIGIGSTVEALKRDGIEFTEGTHDTVGFRGELTQLWKIYTLLAEDAQEKYTLRLIDWIAGEGECPDINQAALA